jgi:rod shape determining protein RodA
LAILAIGIVGWLVVCSATLPVAPLGSPPVAQIGPEAARQGLWFGLGVMGLLAFAFVPPILLQWLAWPLYAVSLALLGAVMLPGFGHSANGAQRWLSLGGITLQPSEIAKLALVLVLAHVLSRAQHASPRMRWLAYVLCGILAALPCGLIMLQPDLGTALVLLAVTAIMVFVAGCSPALLLGLLTAGISVAPRILKQYQRDRLLVFLHPDMDPRGLGYNLIQSKMAIGAGGLWGQGLFCGLMSQLHYVPEQRTDFIFSVMGEELGFVGCVAFLCLYLMLGICLARAAWRAPDRFGQLLISGLGGMFAFHVVVNAGMTLGVLPVVGIPLPLVSYGGTAVLTDLLAIGAVMAVSPRPQLEGAQAAAARMRAPVGRRVRILVPGGG